uniref:Uncharacterized protein LOC113791384 n=1 Tax=Dermatophagoides pteronyssinus TaxID=6956 RepID=A0A6P6XYC3_DERPT|nr:uncharacterized protein LOC113791384 [Dermatophagoides pteronyssinus]
MSLIRWFALESIPYKNLDHFGNYLRQTRQIYQCRKINQSCEASLLINKLIWFQILQLIRYGFLYVWPLSEEYRIIMFDIFHFYNMSSTMNLLAIFLTILGIYLLIKLYYQLPPRFSLLIDRIVFKRDYRFFINKNHKQNKNVCDYIRGKLLESIIQNQLFVFFLDLFVLYSLYMGIQFVTSFEHDYFLIIDHNSISSSTTSVMLTMAKYLQAALKIIILFTNIIVFGCANFMMAHCYMLLIYLFIFMATTFFLKLDQVNMILDKDKFLALKHQNILNNRRTLSRFLYLHGKTLDHINHISNFQSDLFTSYIIANLPMNLLLIITTFFLRKSEEIVAKGLYFFCTLVIIQHFIGFFFVHLICSIFTVRIHKCSLPLIYWFVHSKFASTRLRLRLCYYIERMHNNKRIGLTLGGTHVISIRFFIQVNLINCF